MIKNLKGGIFTAENKFLENIKSNLSLYSLLFIALLIRLISSFYIEGHPIDITCFKAWAQAAADNFTGFYNLDMFVDYPPLYIYILAALAKIAAVFGALNSGWSYTLIIKLPPILCDVMISYFIFMLAKKRLNLDLAYILMFFYAFNPNVIINSTLWGQIDSVFTLLLILALWLLFEKKYEFASVLFAASVLLKPQGLIFLPILLFELLKNKNPRKIFSCFLTGMVTFILIILPFSFSQEPFWIFKLYLNTASGYKGASINAFNLFALFGANWLDDSNTLFIFSYSTWGFIFIVLVTLFTFYLYMKGKGDSMPFLTSLILITGVFMLSSKMHERYLYPSMALLLITFILSNDKRMLWLFYGFSATGFINTCYVFVLSLQKIYWVPADDLTLKIVSFINILFMIYLFKISVDLLLRNKFLKGQ